MTIEFEVGVLATEVLERVAGAWQPVQFRQMLDELDYGDTTGLSDEELRELSLMSLQDLEPHSAAEVVLRARFGDRLRSGQIRNCAHEMLDEKLWEQYAEMSFHEDFFHVGSLLWEAFPRDFPTPDAARVAVEVTPLDAPGRKLLDRPLAEPIIVRLLADGMPPTAVLHRLFGDQIAGGPFSEAEFIVWEFQQTPIHDRLSGWMCWVRGTGWTLFLESNTMSAGTRQHVLLRQNPRGHDAAGRQRRRMFRYTSTIQEQGHVRSPPVSS